MEEEWKDIPNLKGYQASNLGNIRSLNYDRTNKIKNLSKFKSKCGYLRVKITIDGIGKRKKHKGYEWHYAKDVIL